MTELVAAGGSRRLPETLANAGRYARAARRRVLPAWRCVTGLGRSVLAAAVICWLLGWRLGWQELILIATGAAVLLLACALLVLGRTALRMQLSLDPPRVVVGDQAAGQIRITNAARRTLLPLSLRLPVGPSSLPFGLPTLRPGGQHELVFVMHTDHRCVLPVGPVRTERGDPLGLLRRVATWTERQELFVHPVTVQLEPLGSGLLRDLEGQTTTELSMSDLAFHALREYQPGDDIRHVHWRSSAKPNQRSSSRDNQLMVRQYLDTKRSHFTMLVDSRSEAYRDPDEFELAISVAASMAVRGARDRQAVTVVAGNQYASGVNHQQMLDNLARVEAGSNGLVQLAARAARQSLDTSVAVLITGPNVEVGELRRAASAFPPEVRIMALRIDPARPTGFFQRRELTVLTLRTLAELRPLLSSGLA